MRIKLLVATGYPSKCQMEKAIENRPSDAAYHFKSATFPDSAMLCSTGSKDCKAHCEGYSIIYHMPSSLLAFIVNDAQGKLTGLLFIHNFSTNKGHKCFYIPYFIFGNSVKITIPDDHVGKLACLYGTNFFFLKTGISTSHCLHP